MGSRENNSDSRQNRSSNKGSLEDGGSLFKLLNKELQSRRVVRENYDYSAIMSGSMNIRKRINTEDSNSREISSVETKPEKYGWIKAGPTKTTLSCSSVLRRGSSPRTKNGDTAYSELLQSTVTGCEVGRARCRDDLVLAAVPLAKHFGTT